MGELPFKDASFDLVTALDVMEHDDNDDVCLKESFRVTDRGGLLLITVPAYKFMWGDHDRAAHHRTRYTLKEVKRLVEATGYAVIRVSYMNTLLFPIAFIFRQIKNVIGFFRKGRNPKSDFGATAPPVINWMLFKIFLLEKWLLSKYDFPFGLTVICIGRKI